MVVQCVAPKFQHSNSKRLYSKNNTFTYKNVQLPGNFFYKVCLLNGHKKHDFYVPNKLYLLHNKSHLHDYI